MAFNKKNMAKGADNSLTGKLNQLVEGTEITGNITSDSNFRIDGKINGTLNIKGKLVLGTNGFIDGEVNCENAEIEGSFNGVLNVKSFLSLRSTAKLTGDIYTQKIAVEPGATFTGNCVMGEKKPSINSTVLQKEEVLA